jgi:ABC-type multidrug transport system ATPase subunit
MEMLNLKDISFASQSTKIIQNVSFTVDEGTATALVGPSGCGKSTLLKLAAGLIIPTSGEVSYKGQNLFSMSRAENLAFRKESAFVFQDSALWANQSLQQCLELPLKVHFPEMSGKERQQRIDEVTKLVGYRRGLEIRPASLSMGEQKLIGFARALLCKPSMLFLDEFTESLDDYTARRLIAIVKQMKVNNNTIIFISHNRELIQSLADYVIMVIGGCLYTKVTHEQFDTDEELSELLEIGIT